MKKKEDQVKKERKNKRKESNKQGLLVFAD